MSEPRMHRHYRVALITGALATAGVGAAMLAAAAPAVAAAAGIGVGTVGLYAGGHWARRKLGIPAGSGRRWRSSQSRSRRIFGGGGRTSGGGRGSGRGLRLPKLGGRGSSGARRAGGVRLPKLGGGGRGRSQRLKGALMPGSRARGTSGAGARKGLRLPKLGGKRAGTGRGGKLPKLGGGAGRRGMGGRRTAGARLLPRLRGAHGSGGGASRRGGRLLPRLGSGRGPHLPSLGRRSAIGRKAAGGRGRGLAGTAPKGSGKRTGPMARRLRKLRTAGEHVAAPFFLAALAGRWAWRKARRRKPEPAAAPAPAKAPADKPPGVPVPDADPKMSRPSRTGRPVHNLREGPHIMNHLDAASEAAAQHIGGWTPENATDLDLFLSGLPDYFAAVASAFNTVAERLADGYPVHPSVPERLREIASTIGGMADYSGEAHAAHRAMHERELERLENPRRNEQFWDVSTQ